MQITRILCDCCHKEIRQEDAIQVRLFQQDYSSPGMGFTREVRSWQMLLSCGKSTTTILTGEKLKDLCSQACLEKTIKAVFQTD